METWYKVSLSEKDISNGQGKKLQDAFEVLFMANGAPHDAAMFDYVSVGPPYDCFFTPGTARIAEILLSLFGAVECEKPMGHQVVLLVGHSDAVKVFFNSAV
jgi:hypothetical protein